jgi:hypothetical protein
MLQPTPGNQEEMLVYAPTSSGIRTNDPSVRLLGDSKRFGLRMRCDGQ